MNRYAKAPSSVTARTFDPNEGASAVDAQLEDLRRSVAALEVEIDAIAAEPNAHSGTVPGARLASDFVTAKRGEIQRLNARLAEIERLLSAG
ncbi:hypothetical protein J2Z31_000785 [Sinorhizobium kostiense]|uniref:Valyl-tRNA synthetase tRNA-binding arm domain-containing protein n=1 Tax=Sinorhizobium kostiense TaxID=76747 RepID=A0ABS4QUF9_9HYPH|nr:hypothetical protein [Sinorhizobium kostiense]MBP2234295.1 hypothetical protein [Sinorhizobium kostiense]